jgi:O-acetyl-ADP-ribose deacetylase (regulator of RNase III)
MIKRFVGFRPASWPVFKASLVGWVEVRNPSTKAKAQPNLPHSEPTHCVQQLFLNKSIMGHNPLGATFGKKGISMEDRVLIEKGDITQQKVDAIVNAANQSLLGGGGVDGAIHRAAGPELLEETREIGGCLTGEARVSKGYRLPATWVVHTVGPIWAGGHKNEENLLADCYRNSFKEALGVDVKTIAFPSISTGAYRFPLERATEIAMKETKKILDNDKTLTKVVFVCFGDDAFNTYQEVYKRVFGE